MAQNPALQRSAKDLDRQDSSSSISPSKKDFTTNEFGVGFAGQDTRTNTAVFHQGTIAVLSAAVCHVQQCFKFIPSDVTPRGYRQNQKFCSKILTNPKPTAALDAVKAPTLVVS
jgi:hypothetical protein